jgi:hypothetical protein
MRSPLHSKFFVPLLTGLLFLLLFPVLDIFTHPFSVMHGQYIPLVIRLSDFYWRTWVLGTALFGVPLLLVHFWCLRSRVASDCFVRSCS